MNRYGRVLTLAFLAPFIAEFLFGATPLSRITGFMFPALLTSAGWFGLLFLPETLKHETHSLVPILAAAGVAIAVGSIVKRWSTRRNWTDQHRLAVVLGALPVTMCFGFFIVTAGNRMDQAGQAVGCLITLVFLALLARRLGRRSRPVLTRSSAA